MLTPWTRKQQSLPISVQTGIYKLRCSCIPVCGDFGRSCCFLIHDVSISGPHKLWRACRRAVRCMLHYKVRRLAMRQSSSISSRDEQVMPATMARLLNHACTVQWDSKAECIPCNSPRRFLECSELCTDSYWCV